MIDAIDGATLGGLIVLLFGLLMMVAHFGAFDGLQPPYLSVNGGYV